MFACLYAASGDLAALVAGLFSPLAHDLRAGLNGISVWTHLLSRDADEVVSSLSSRALTRLGSMPPPSRPLSILSERPA